MKLKQLSPINIFKTIFLSMLYLFGLAFLIFAFYFVKNLIGLANNFEFSLLFIGGMFLKSIGLMVNLLLAYKFFIKLIIKNKGVIKAKNPTLVFLGLLIANIILNDVIISLCTINFSLSLTIANIIAFVLLYVLNKLVKGRLTKKS
ncbi:MAG: hypothetical protein AB7S44_02000 [Spirochaetales bacterium]